MTEAAIPLPVTQSAVDWFKAKFPDDGAECIERWTKGRCTDVGH
jgi:hypothetical protein